MAKKLAIINDLSGFGRCSLTAAISVSSAMGIHACPLPTSILSSQTGFSSYYCYDFSKHMKHIQSEWEQLDVSFDGIYTGFVSCEEQLDQVLSFIQSFRTESNFLLVDPVLGDDGVKYDMFTPSLKDKMVELAKIADVITPNLTELCLLCDVSYDELTRNLKETDKEDYLNRIHALGRTFSTEGPSKILITGIRYFDSNGEEYIGNSYVSPTEEFHVSYPLLGGSYSGTGDLFASCVACGLLNEESIESILKTTGNFINASIADSVAEKIPFIEGVNFEKHLMLLIKP